MSVTPNAAMLDTNVIVRLVTLDASPNGVASAVRILQQAHEGAIRLDLRPMVVAEAMFVLNRHYQMEREPAAAAMRKLMGRRGIECREAESLGRALELWERRPGLHFVDCYLIATAERAGHAVATLDGGIARTKLVPVIDGLDPPRA